MLSYLVFVGAALHFTGTSIYIKNTIRGYTKPNRVTFLVWAAGPFVAVAAGLSKEVGLPLLPVFMAGFGPLLIFIASFLNPHAYWKLTKFDWACGICAAAAILLWAVTSEPNVAIALAIVSDAFGLLPLAIKAWKYPETETGFGYFLAFINAVTGFAAVQVWSFSETAFLVYLLFANGIPVVFIYRHGFFSRVRQEIFRW